MKEALAPINDSWNLWSPSLMTTKTLNCTDHSTWLGVSRLYGFEAPYPLILGSAPKSDTILIVKHRVDPRLVGFWSDSVKRGVLMVHP